MNMVFFLIFLANRYKLVPISNLRASGWSKIHNFDSHWNHGFFRRMDSQNNWQMQAMMSLSILFCWAKEQTLLSTKMKFIAKLEEGEVFDWTLEVS